MRKISYAQAIMEAIQEEFRRDEKTVHMSTDTPFPLLEEFGKDRIKSTPISESAFVGASIGLAGSGFKVVTNIRRATFMFVATDQIVNQAAKITYMFGGQAKFPIVYRIQVGDDNALAAQHIVNPYSMFMNVPGIKIILPSTPYDAKGLMKTAIRDNNPVLFCEHTALHSLTGEVPEDDYTIPFGKAKIWREGSDVTVIALSKMVHEALSVAEELEKEGISIEVIDPRSLVPMDKETIRASVAKTGRLIVVDEACQTCSAAAEIINVIVEDKQTFQCLKTAPKRICAYDVPIPYSPILMSYVLP
ncbi:MAG: transketolase C-terminal domain-containing protein, partial [Pseudomonadota bacterium]